MNGDKVWDNLKLDVLRLLEIESVEPKDCKILSLSISKATNKNISETTFKRIYGFAASRNEASLYTRNALAQYCGYAGWEGYTLSIYGKASNPENRRDSWENMRVETNKVNFFSLNAVKHKALIPFTKMIEREFVKRHFRSFVASGALATVIAAPTGYGKTVAICQWVNEKLAEDGGNDLVLYLNTSFLLSSLKSSVNMEYWMMKMVGLVPSEDFHQLSSEAKEGEGKFYFVIDGFDEFMFNKNQFEVLTHLLLDILSSYKSNNWFRVVILMRDSTWLNWSSQLMINPSSWFIGEMNEQGQNAGLLTINELSTLMDMKRAFTEKELLSDNFLILRFPLFHFYFYKKYSSIINFEQFNEILIFELATDYMRQNILHGNQALTKLEFIFYLISKTEWLGDTYKIDKAKVMLIKRGLVSIYSSLIQIGFLYEVDNGYALRRPAFIHFFHYHFLGCCVAAFILRDDANFSVLKLEYVQLRWGKDSKLKICILKWCLFQSVVSGNLTGWVTGYQEHLSANNLQELMPFILQLEAYR